MSLLAFWGTVALLLAGALLFVLPPLLRPEPRLAAGPSPLAAYRDELAQLDGELAQGTMLPSQHARALEELQGRVLDEVGDRTEPAPPTAGSQRRSSLATVVAVAVLVPAGALGLYALLGQPAALLPFTQAAAPATADAPHTLSRERMEQTVERLAEKLKAQPNDADGWHMLARSYLAFGRIPEAAQAYGRAAALNAQDPQLLADYADALAMVNGKNLEGRPTELVQQALALDPNHPKALSLSATAAFNRADYPAAIATWRKLQALLPPGSDAARSVAGSIGQAELLQRAPQAAQAQAPAAAAPAAAVAGEVRLADALKARLAPGSTLYVYARALQGPRMPLAILRVPAEGFPVKFRLDDTMAMSPQFALSSQREVVLSARISRTGNATPQAGDLAGTLAGAKVGAGGLAITIDEVLK